MVVDFCNRDCKACPYEWVCFESSTLKEDYENGEDGEI